MFCFYILFLSFSSYAVENSNPYILGVFPHLPKHKLFKMYNKVAIDISRKLNRKIKIKTKSSFETFESSLRSEEFDIALIQPFDYPDAHDKYNYLPLARRTDNLASILIVKKESSFQSLKDLKNHVIGNPAKSAAVSRLTDRTIK